MAIFGIFSFFAMKNVGFSAISGPLRMGFAVFV